MKSPWRIYRLPGSRMFWHIDTGVGTPVINVLAFHVATLEVHSRDIGDGFPRAWIEIPRNNNEQLHIIQGAAYFSYDTFKEIIGHMLELAEV